MMEPGPRRRLSEPLATVLGLYEQGQCLAAWEAGQSLGPLESWPAVEGRLLAGRLAPRLGAPRLGSLLHLKLFRAHPDHPGVQYYYIWRVFEHRGALAAWLERKRLGPPATDIPEHLADYHGQCAQLLGRLRDFETASRYLENAMAAAPDRAYSFVERAELRELEDRFEEALDAAQQALALNGRSVPAIATVAHCLQLLDRNDAALELLRAKSIETESADIVAHLILLLLKLRLVDEVEAALARYDALTPLKEKDPASWLAWTRADIATHRGDYQTALSLIRQVDHPYHKNIAENLQTFLREAGNRRPRRVELPVAFVRQHHQTCAPATLSAISQFWNRPAAHLSVAEEICYDGTPAHSERRWAEENGWRVREFRVDWPTATALLDRRVPFTLTISDAVAGHLQAVIGYDEATGVLLARDPMVPGTIEMNARPMIAQQRATGPRGMAMVPAEQARVLDGVSFSEAELYDLYHALQLALERHDRERAVEIARQMAARDAGHRLTLTARRALAGYDANPHEALGAIDALLELYPDDQALQLSRLHHLRHIAGRDERLAWLRRMCSRPESDPILWIEYAAELGADDRQMGAALWYLRRAMRRRRDEPYGMTMLAELYWRLGRKEESIELYRFAACLDDRRESCSQRYFTACRWQRQTDTALQFLRNRVERLGGQSGLPAITLFWALETLDRTDEAFLVLEAAVEQRPDDGDLRLFAAGKCEQYGRPDEAGRHRAAAEGHVKRTAWLAEVAREARLQGNRDQALECWREIVRVQPLDLEAHRMIALLLSETSTRHEAVDHLQTCCETFPHHAGLHRLLYDWTAGDPAVERERVLLKLLEIDGADAWARRELALNLHYRGCVEDALRVLDEAIALDGTHAAGYAIKGHVLQTAGRPDEAATCFRDAIRRSADTSNAIHGLLDVAGGTVAHRQEVLEFVESQLLAQTVLGDGLLAFREAARGVLTPDELLAALRRAHQQRPDLWHAWSALSRHLAEMGQTDEALETARRATERFSKVPPLWLDLGRIHQVRLEVPEQIEALERCREISPEWTAPILELADAWQRSGHPDRSEALLDAAIKRTPLVPELRGRLAALFHARGEHDRAIETLREALRINPDYGWAWHALTDWSDQQGRTTRALDLARAFAESRPGESHPWVRLAELHLGANRPEAALDAIDRAVRINPRNVDAYDIKASALVALRRFAEAEAACRPEALDARPPVTLLGRAAWVDAQRGDLTQAVKRMEALLEANPDYRWGWRQLMEWYAEQGKLTSAVRAAERLVWLDPTDVVPLGWLGNLKRRLGDHRDATAVFQRAMHLEPSYLYAGFQYLDLQIADSDFDGAQRTLEILRLHAPREQILSAQVRVEVGQAHQASALELMEELCRHSAFDRQAVEQAAEAILSKGWGKALERALKQVLAGSGWHAATPPIWARVRLSRGRYGGMRGYGWLARLGEPGREAICDFLAGLGDRARRPGGETGLVRTWLAWHLLLIRLACRGWRERDDLYWGQVAYALVCRGKMRAGARWMRDWRRRTGAEAWMLQNLAVALMHRRDDRETRAVLRRVAEHFTVRGPVGPHLKLWCVLGACLEDDLALAERLLHETPRDVVPEANQQLREFGETVVAILRDAPARASLTKERRDVIARTRAWYGGTPNASIRLFRLAKYKVARHARDPWMTISAWAGLHPWLAGVIGVALGSLVIWGLALLA